MYKLITILFFLLGYFNLKTYSQSETYEKLWSDPEIQQRINSGIETNRKGWFTLNIVDQDNQPISDASINLELTNHEFLFGSNIFMYQGFPDQKQNQRYEDVFKQIFNFASLPFYWKALEPEPGVLRYEANSEKIYRRPPPDPILAYCKENNITPKGHTLVWDNPTWSIPEWLPENAEKREELINKRISQLGERYGESIKYWDVVNELDQRAGHMEVVMPKDFALKAFKQAEAVYPRENTLILNEVTNVWYKNAGEYSNFYTIIDNLLMKGAKIDAIGFQCHFFGGERDIKAMMDGKLMQPKQILDILDTYGEFQLPIHVTEITVPTIPNNAEGEKIQALITENLYKIWFSHKNVEAITWWNVADGTATKNEDKFLGGVLRGDLSAKPSFDVLNRLINEDWHTKIVNQNLVDSQLKFNGFFGEYTVKIQYKGKTIEKKINLTKNGLDKITIKI
ncbi:endo-1,4-beta-xylanase [Chondrinema litorale]|uniref:endo-1,4-beta-xylanase n=1 Tax=Chondrinema litorale TaxID=2994555 RepID=UPI002542CA39|nr:endo-1,4-beta-xylanase [Chondrinema litorale]UZR99550.1 endo-1,4-beta-xylanase [Chondrinema litorale]